MGSIVFSIATFLAILGFNTGAHGETRCLDVIQWRGNIEEVSVLKERLQDGLLASVPGGPCEGVVIQVYFTNGIWRFLLQRGPDKSSHQGPDLVVASTWIESQLAPPVSIVIAPRGKVTSTGPTPTPPPVVIPASLTGPPLLAALFTGGVFSPHYSGGALDMEADLRLGPRFWGGISAGGAILPEQNGVRRDRLTLTLLAGTRHDLRRLQVLPGLGLGLASTDMTQAPAEEEDAPLETRRLDLLGSVFLRAQLALSRRLVLLLDLSVQYSIYNLSLRDTGPAGSNTNNESLEARNLKANFHEQGLVPMDNLSFVIRLGLAWRWGGW
jgi:hypothetical protein